MLCLMAVVYLRARQKDWPVDSRPSLKRIGQAALHAAIPMVVPFVILAGFILGVITATEAGAVVAAYAFLAAKLGTARFYADHILTRSSSLAESIIHGARGVLALPEEAF